MKLIFDKDNARVVSENDEIAVFYVDDFLLGTDMECGDEVFEKVVEMFNNGKTLAKIDAYLLETPLCTQDAREVITEGLYSCFKEELDRRTSLAVIYAPVTEPWASVEINACQYVGDNSIETCDEEDADFYSVYLRLNSGMVQCVADFTNKHLAENLKLLLETAAETYIYGN